MIDVYDDVLEEHNAILIDDEIKKIAWKYDYPSEPSKPNKHWHVLCGHNKEECDAASYDWAHSLFDMFVNKFDFKSKYDVVDYERIYCNAHTHGIEPHLHIDDGDFTMIYYPRMDWKKEWGGGTLVDETLVPYAGNRLVVFTASLPHKAMPVSRECYQLRTCVVFKCNQVKEFRKETIDFYKNAIEQGNYKIRFE
ncbi:uncharacterized protein METZ01_LOCUS327207 [marine metagenome]|uniref:Fe2OG dioxygenase domain-containing protein n=1 Tax=marine metagenome TaxID=408172 RepID=A0A382PLW3_9ZZZZ